jgi:hypothetical protein
LCGDREGDKKVLKSKEACVWVREEGFYAVRNRGKRARNSERCGRREQNWLSEENCSKMRLGANMRRRGARREIERERRGGVVREIRMI